MLAAVVVSGCASADKRFNQGAELEMQGQYEQAAARYVQALEKDVTLSEARVRLRETGDLAVAEQMAEANAWASRGDPLGAAPHLRRVDNVVARARSVGVTLALPRDYAERRRVVFDDAFDALLDQGIAASDQGRWQDGLADFQRARRDFEPAAAQREQALAEEAALYVQWSESEYERGRLRSAFGIAANVEQLEWCPSDLVDRAAGNMERYLAEGELELIVLPVQERPGSPRERSRDRDLAAQLEAALQQGPWREPPAFVRMHESLALRDLMIGSGLLDGDYRAAKLALVLRLAEADYAAYLQILGAEATEFEVKSKTQSAKTRAGRTATFVREDGQRRLQATARVVIVDGFGTEIIDVVIAGTGSAPFTRGVYGGDPRELNLSGRQVDLFDRLKLEAQEQVAREALVQDLAAGIADAVFQAALARVP
jgi:tetratricopeptide (TPR) repeat protein